MKSVLLIVSYFFISHAYSNEIQNVTIDKLGKLNCSLISNETKEINGKFFGNFYNCDGFLLVSEGNQLSFLDPSSQTMRSPIIKVNDKEISTLKLENDLGELHSIFRITAFWNSSIKNKKLKQQLRELFIQATSKNISKNNKESQLEKRIITVNDKDVECHKVEKDNFFCPIYSCKINDSSDELFLNFQGNNSNSSLKSYNLKTSKVDFINFKINNDHYFSPNKCLNENDEYKYGCELSLSHMRSIQQHCKTEKVKKIIDFDIEASEQYLIYKYISLALDIKQSVQKQLSALGSKSNCVETLNLGFDLSVIEEDLAQRVMKDISEIDLNENFLRDGCYQRASVITTLMAEKYKIEPFKVFISGEMTSKISPDVSWNSHVAAAVKVKSKEGVVQTLIIDPIASKNKMLEVDEWLETVNIHKNDFEKGLNPIEIKVAPRWSNYGEIEPFSKNSDAQLECIACELEWHKFDAIFNGFYSIENIPK